MARGLAIVNTWLALVVGVLGGCGAVQEKTHTVGGQLRGLWTGSDGVALRLEADGSNTLLTVSSNGPFSFGRILPGGTSYTVTVATKPPRHTCAVDTGANGTVADDEVTTVSIACSGPTISVELSGQWGWVFDPTQDTQTFTGSVATQ